MTKRAVKVDALEQVKAMFPNDIIIFCNGVTELKKISPKEKVKNIRFEYGIGGNKKKKLFILAAKELEI